MYIVMYIYVKYMIYIYALKHRNKDVDHIIKILVLIDNL